MKIVHVRIAIACAVVEPVIVDAQFIETLRTAFMTNHHLHISTATTVLNRPGVAPAILLRGVVGTISIRLTLCIPEVRLLNNGEGSVDTCAAILNGEGSFKRRIIGRRPVNSFD